MLFDGVFASSGRHFHFCIQFSGLNRPASARTHSLCTFHCAIGKGNQIDFSCFSRFCFVLHSAYRPQIVAIFTFHTPLLLTCTHLHALFARHFHLIPPFTGLLHSLAFGRSFAHSHTHTHSQLPRPRARSDRRGSSRRRANAVQTCQGVRVAAGRQAANGAQHGDNDGPNRGGVAESDGAFVRETICIVHASVCCVSFFFRCFLS